MALLRKTTVLFVAATAGCAALSLFGDSRAGAGRAQNLRPLTAADWHQAATGAAALPAILFWAWERPEDLRFLHPQQAGVAFLAETIEPPSPHAESSATPLAAPFTVRPRLQPLRTAPNVPLIAVIRIETRLGNRTHTWASVTPQDRERMATEIADLENLPSVRAVQIDFDATTREHAFYSLLLQDVRRKLSPSMPLSITALASWCIGDPWLAQLPPGTIDEAVPMLFRMGADAANVVRFVRSHEEFAVPACQASLGVSTDEPFSRHLLAHQFFPPRLGSHQKRVYVFAPRGWTQSAANSILEEWSP